MSKLLYIQASPRVGRSHSIVVADAFVESYRQFHRNDEIVIMNLYKKDLPPFDGLRVQAKYTILHGKEHTREERDAWRQVEQIIDEFKSADKYVMAVPMWNFGIPYRLKQYIDILVQPGYTFSWSPQTGYSGMVKAKAVFIVYARGGEYSAPDAAAFDFQQRYMETILEFIGLTGIQSVIVEPTLQAGPDVAKGKCEQAIRAARKIAETF